MIAVDFIRYSFFLVRVGVNHIAKGFILGYYNRTKLIHNLYTYYRKGHYIVVELITSIWFQHSNGNKKDMVPTLMRITSISVPTRFYKPVHLSVIWLSINF